MDQLDMSKTNSTSDAQIQPTQATAEELAHHLMTLLVVVANTDLKEQVDATLTKVACIWQQSKTPTATVSEEKDVQPVEFARHLATLLAVASNKDLKEQVESTLTKVAHISQQLKTLTAKVSEKKDVQPAAEVARIEAPGAVNSSTSTRLFDPLDEMLKLRAVHDDDEQLVPAEKRLLANVSIEEIRASAKRVSEAYRGDAIDPESIYETIQSFERMFAIKSVNGNVMFEFPCVEFNVDPRVLAREHGRELFKRRMCPVDIVVKNLLEKVSKITDKVVILQLCGRAERECPRGWYDDVVRAVLDNPVLDRVLFEVQSHTVLPDTWWCEKFQERYYSSCVLVPDQVEAYTTRILNIQK
jgi:hypothetical protein